jgi:serine-type D-Ala-D-Ala carboxypeptidase
MKWNGADIERNAAVSRAQPNPGGLVDDTAGQEHRFAQPFRLVDDAIARKVCPGAALAVTLRGTLLAWRAFGRFTYDAPSPRFTPDAAPDRTAAFRSEVTRSDFSNPDLTNNVTRETVWDLASLTKPIATTSMAMLLFERGKLSLDTTVSEVLPDFAASSDLLHRGWREQVTVRMLLAHSSGLPAHRKLYLAADSREAMLAAARRVPLEAAPMERAEYSDIGFILLGELLERVAGEPLDAFCRREVFAPLNLNFTFTSQPSDMTNIPPTMNDTAYRGRILQGEVNDENASAMGGVAGHAGLFGDALSVARFAHCLLAPETSSGGTLARETSRPGQPLCRPETIELFTTRQPEPPGTSRALGWDTPSQPSQSGTRFSPRSFGHLGYTGTSVWCDPARGLSVTLLTNRTWPDARNQAIKELRPRLHDAIIDALPSH